jgi:hypothetical protein
VGAGNVPKRKVGFRKAFEDKTGALESDSKIKIPKFPLECMADVYAYHVLIMGIDPQTFWESDLNFLSSAEAGNAAYSRYTRYKAEQLKK